MTFWTATKDQALQPKRKDLFLVQLGGIFGNQDVWWAKSIKKPNISYQANVGPQAGLYYMGAGQSGQKVGYINPGGLNAFDPITMNLVDIDTEANPVSRQLMEYMFKSGKSQDYYGIENATRDIGNVFIEQLAHGRDQSRPSRLQAVERWRLYQPYVITANFGDLSYADDNLIDLSLTIGYTGFKVEFISLSGETSAYTFGEQPIEEEQT